MNTELMPNSVDTERVLLAQVFLDNDLFSQVAVLEPSDFYNGNFRDAYVAMRNLAARSVPIDPVTLFNEMKQVRPTMNLTMAEITNWTWGVPVMQDVGIYISLLQDKSLKRNIIRMCDSIARKARDEEDLASAITADAVSSFQNAYNEAVHDRKPTITLAEGLEGNYERWEKMLRGEIVTVETGISEIDAQLTGGGFEKGMFHVIGARPAKGKTTLGLDIAAHNVLTGSVVVFFTMELSKDVLMDRFIAPLAGIPRYRITSKWITQTDKNNLVKMGEAIKHLPLFLNAQARSVEDIRLALKDVARQTGGKIDVVIVDFLTKMKLGKASKYESVSENANGLAGLAIEFGCATIVLAQLSRGVEKRTTLDDADKGRIELTDFRDSGEIEELGRTILGLWGSDTGSPLRKVNISCLKQGEGGLFDMEAVLNTDLMTFGVRKPLWKSEQDQK